MPNKTIALLGGTFDPIHNAHLALAQATLDLKFIDEVHFIPCFEAIHEKNVIASAKHRVAMLQLALQTNDNFIYNPIEVDNKHALASIDTIEQLRHHMPEATLCWIMGSDVFAQFNKWDRWQDMLALCNLIVATRPNSPLPTSGIPGELLHERQIKDQFSLQAGTTGCIIALPAPMMDISATDIRQACKEKNWPKEQLPSPVIEYIQQHKLY